MSPKAQLFQAFLERDGFLPVSRTPKIADAFSRLHKALAQLDGPNTARFWSRGHNHSLPFYLHKFAELEELRELVPHAQLGPH